MRYWEDLRIGEEAEHGSHTITEEEILAFAREYDPQPFHVDPEAAAAGPFGGLIASGWQTAAIYMGLYVRNALRDVVALGSPGGAHIPTATLQVLLALVVDGDTLDIQDVTQIPLEQLRAASEQTLPAVFGH